MSSPDTIDERYEEIARELRLLPGAPERLRHRVAEIAAREPEPEPRRLPRPRLPLRRVALGTGALAASFAVAAAVYGFATSADRPDAPAVAAGSNPAQRESLTSTTASAESGPAGGGATQKQPAPTPTPVFGEDADGAGGATALSAPPPSPPPPPVPGERRLAPANVAPSNGRLQRYEATMRLRVKNVDDLSRRTAQAMRIARRLGGFVEVVRYGNPQRGEGQAFLRLRVPAANVQEAVVSFSQLGTILSQRVSIVDLQQVVGQATDDIGRLRATIRRLETALEKGGLEEYERLQIQAQLANTRALLKRRTTGRENTIRSARLSLVSLTLTTREGAAVVAPTKPGRIERSARNALSFLSKGTAVAVFLLIVLSPLLLAGLAGLVGNRFRRRRVETRLLETA